MLRAGLRSAVAAFAAALILCRPPLHAQHEDRALWVVRTTLTSPSAIATFDDLRYPTQDFDDSLTDPSRGPGSLSQVSRAAFSTSGE